MQALTSERLNRMIEECRTKCEALDPEKYEELDKEMAVDFSDHFQFQQLQASCHVQGVLTSEAAQIVYVALGEIGSESNGGWAAGTDLPTKVIITQLMGELLKLKIAGKVA